jgi:hypothetical protein
MVREIYISSSSETAFHNFTVYLTKIMVEGRQASLKVMEILDFPKDDLNGFCTEKIGVSPFSKRPKELELIQGLINEYAFTIMEGSDPLWWVRKAVEQTQRLINEFPQVLVAMGGLDKDHYLNFAKEKGKVVMGVKLAGEELLLKDEIDNEFIFNLKQDFKLTTPEEIDDVEIDKLKLFLNKIGVTQCETTLH